MRKTTAHMPQQMPITGLFHTVCSDEMPDLADLQPVSARLKVGCGQYPAGTNCQAMRFEGQFVLGFGSAADFQVIKPRAMEGVEFEIFDC